MLYCKKLDDRAILPTVSHPDEDLGYDLYAIEEKVLHPSKVAKVRTGIAARFIDDYTVSCWEDGTVPMGPETNYGLLFRDRSSMAAKGITVSGGVIDAGYTGELLVLLTNHSSDYYLVEAGSKVVQMIPTKVLTKKGSAFVAELPVSSREDKGFGSTGN